MSTLQDAFRAGYMAAPETENPYLWSSQLWDGFALGQYFRRTRRDYALVRKSRGDTYRTASGDYFRIHYQPLRIETITS